MSCRLKEPTLFEIFTKRIQKAVLMYVIIDLVQVILLLSIVSFDILYPQGWFQHISIRFCDKLWTYVVMQACAMHVIGSMNQAVYSASEGVRVKCYRNVLQKLVHLCKFKNCCICSILMTYCWIKFLILRDLFDGWYEWSEVQEYFRYAGPFVGVCYFFSKCNSPSQSSLQLLILNYDIWNRLQDDAKRSLVRAFEKAFICSLLYHVAYFFVIGYVKLSALVILWFLSTISILSLICMDNAFHTILCSKLELPITGGYLSRALLTKEDYTNARNGSPGLMRSLIYQDLANVAENDLQRRKEIFYVDVMRNIAPNWQDLIRACLKVMSDFTVRLVVLSHEVSCLSTGHDCPPPFPQRVQPPPGTCYCSGVDVVPGGYPKLVLSKKRERSKTKTFKKHWLNKVTRTYKRLCHRWKLLQAEASICEHLCSCEDVTNAVMASAGLLMKAIAEDAYGVTQSDIPGVLENLLQLRFGLESLQRLDFAILLSGQKLASLGRARLQSTVERSLMGLASSYEPYLRGMDLPWNTKEELIKILKCGRRE